MTIASQTNRISYTGNGVTTAFAVSFPFQSANDLVVVETIIATGVQTTKTITTHYTVSGTPDSLGYYPNGGTVTAVTAPASTVTWTIYRAPALLQSLNLAENNALPAESLEAQLDYLTMLVQRLNDRVNRSVRQPDGDSADIAVMPSKVSRASKYIAFDAAGDPIATAGTTEANPVSAYMATVLDDTTAAAARTTLGAVADITGTITDNLTITGNASDVTHVPQLRLNTTHATEKRAQIQFMKSGTSKYVISTDFDAANGTNSLTFYDAELAENTLQITSAGVVSVPKGQVKFPATQNASADVNTLDDYEEGTWTPSVGGTATYTAQSGVYVKIGKVVYIQCNLVINVLGTGSTGTISGLPFTSAGTLDAPLTVSDFSSLATSVVWIAARVNTAATTITLRNLTAAGATATTSTLFGNGTAVTLAGFYFV